MYSRAILSNMLWVPSGEVHEKVKESLIFIPTYENLAPIKAYREVNGLFGFPRNYRINVSKITKEVSDGCEIQIDFRGTLRPEQVPVVDKFVENWRDKIDDQIIVADTGCHAPGTQILMYDGSIKLVESIRAGDLLMGPDSRPRKVSRLYSGTGTMYTILPKKGKPWIVNEKHVLRLRRTPMNKDDLGTPEINITLEDYLSRSNRFKHLYKLYKPAQIVFKPIKFLPFTPYFMGVYLGDGGGGPENRSVNVTTADREIVDAVYSEANRFGVSIRVENLENNASSMYYFTTGVKGMTNPVKDTLRLHGLDVSCGRKFITDRYKFASINDRYELLAGLLDTDGSLSNNCYDFISKSYRLREDACFVARSLGLRATAGFKDIKGTRYYRASISGHTDRIPCRIPRKQATIRLQKKSPLTTGFTVDKLCDGSFYGFEVSGDHLYLLGDFTVTHNSGKTVMALAMMCKLKRTTLVIVPKTDLLKQWKDKILEFTDCQEHEIGLARQSVCEFEGKKIVIGMIHSLSKDKYPKEFVNYFGVVVTDEIHKLGATTFSNTACLYPARYRLGATATLQRADGMDAIINAHLGYTIIKPNKSVQPNPTVAFSIYRKSSGRIPHWATQPMQRRGKLISLLAANRHRTIQIAKAVIMIVKSNRQTMVVSERIEHLKELALEISAYSEGKEIAYGYYIGKTSQKEKERIAKECDLILATTSMLSLGTDIPTLKALIFATPLSNVTQTIGRIRRISEGTKAPFVYDIIDTTYEETVRWARKRRNFYKSKNYEIIDLAE